MSVNWCRTVIWARVHNFPLQWPLPRFCLAALAFLLNGNIGIPSTAAHLFSASRHRDLLTTALDPGGLWLPLRPGRPLWQGTASKGYMLLTPSYSITLWLPLKLRNPVTWQIFLSPESHNMENLYFLLHFSQSPLTTNPDLQRTSTTEHFQGCCWTPHQCTPYCLSKRNVLLREQGQY